MSVQLLALLTFFAVNRKCVWFKIFNCDLNYNVIYDKKIFPLPQQKLLKDTPCTLKTKSRQQSLVGNFTQYLGGSGWGNLTNFNYTYIFEFVTKKLVLHCQHLPPGEAFDHAVCSFMGHLDSFL